jgi:hypothetical protein
MLKKRSGCHLKPRRSVKPTSRKSMKGNGRTHSTANQTTKGQVCGVRELPYTDQLQVWEESGSREPEAAFLFTLKFDDAGNGKIVKTHQMSKKELEDEQEIVYHFRRDRRVHDSLLFFKCAENQIERKTP